MRTVTCPDCWGEKYEEVLAPDPCHEADTEYVACPTCGARGEVPVEDCPACGGRGEVDATRVVAVPEAGNVGRDIPAVTPCLSCDGAGKKARGRRGLLPLPPELVEELERESTPTPRRAIR